MGPKKNQYSPRWTVEDLKAAIDAVAGGMGKRQAAIRFGIPYGTLQDKLTGRRKIVPEETTILKKVEEEEIVEWLKTMSNMGFGARTKEELKQTVKTMLDYRGRTTSWDDNKPSEKWFRLFKQRHPTITFRKPQKLGNLRDYLTVEMVEQWHQQFVSTIKDIDATILLEPERIFNCDESGFAIDATCNRILADIENKYTYQVGAESRTMITILACASAAGQFTSPMMIYPGTQFRGFQPQDVFPASFSFITKSPNGWINQDIFSKWMEAVFIPETRNLKKPVLLLVDGHVSHQSVRTSQLCQENGIVLYCLLAHASHILQPLDVGIFKTMKAEWRKAVREHTIETSEVVTKRNFAVVWKQAYENSVAKNLCPMAFRKSGIYPADLAAVDMSKLIRRGPATTTPSPTLDTSVTEATTAPTPTIDGPVTPGTSAPTPTIDGPVTPGTSAPTPTIDGPVTPGSTAPTPTIDGPVTPGTTATTPTTNDPVTRGTTVPTPTMNATVSASASSFSPSASSSSGPSTLASTLHKFALICNQISEKEIHMYFQQLQDGSKGGPLFELWKVYHDEILQSGNKAPNPKAPQGDPLRQPGPSIVSTNKRKRKAEKLPDLMSGEAMIQILIQKEHDKEEEERKKAERKVDQEKRKKEAEKKKKDKQRLAEEGRKRQEEKKKEAEKRKMEAQKKEERQLKRLLEEEKRKAKKQKKDDSETSVDENEMVLCSELEEDAMSEDSLLGALQEALQEGHQTCPVCCNTSKDTRWIQCAACEAWYHYSCVKNIDLVGMSQVEIKSITSFRCDFCT